MFVSDRHSYYSRAVPGFGFFPHLWRELALAYEQETGDSCFEQRKDKSPQGAIKIASVPLNQYKPEEISVAVDSENITLHGQHRSEDENGFENIEFKKVIKIPQEVDPESVTSRATPDGNALVLEGTERVKEKMEEDNGKFAVNLDLSGFKPEGIKVKLHGQELTITGKQRCEDDGFYWSRDYSRRLLLPNDVDLSSVTSRLSKTGLLTIEASRDPALLPSTRSVDITMEIEETQPEDEAEQATSGDKGEQN